MSSNLDSSTKTLLMSNAWVVLFAVFIALPLVDMLNGVLVVTGVIGENSLGSPSQLGRLLTEALLFFFAFKYGRHQSALLILGCLIIVEIFAALRFMNGYGLLFGLVQANKVVYLVLLSAVFGFLVQRNFLLVAKMLRANIGLVSGSIVFATITGTGLSTYGWGFGSKGYFASGNAVGIYIGSLTLLSMAIDRYFFERRSSSILILISVLSLILITTKTGALMAMVVLLFWFSQQGEGTWVRKLALAAGFAIFLSYLATLLVLAEAVFEVVLLRYENADGDLLQFLGSGRVEYVSDAFTTLVRDGLSVDRVLLGSGGYISFQTPSLVQFYDTLETDVFDIFFMYGLVGLTCYLGTLSYHLFIARHYFWLFLTFALIVGHSLAAGHIVFNGMSAVPLALAMALIVATKQPLTETDTSER